MSGGYGAGQPPTELAFLIERLDKIDGRLDTLERPSGEQLARVVAELTILVNDIQTTLDDYINNHAYTKAQVDTLVASPGNIAPGNVTASGTVSGNYGGDFPAGLRSTGAYSTLVTGGGAYVAAWIHNDGRIGHAPSSRRFKVGFKPIELTIERVLELQGFYFRYLAAVPYDQHQQREMMGLLAEETHAAGFPWLVDYDDEGLPFGIRGDILAVVVLEGMRDFYGRFLTLVGRVDSLEGKPSTDDEGA